MEKLPNPFLSSGYIGSAYFCNRKSETSMLTNYMQNGIHVALFAIRRIGKTGLISHVFHPFQNSKKIACIYLDILATQNLNDFTNQLATAVYNRFPAQKSLGRKFMEMVQHFRPTITFDELTGAPSLSLSIQTKAQKEKSLGQIFSFLDSQNIRVVFAIDEFQQILEYPETNTESILRTLMQQLKNTSFIFCGSNQKLMHQIFNSAKSPFFASCTSMHLDAISQLDYKKFIAAKFKDYHRTIDRECLDFICDFTCLHTFYTQHFCFNLFAKQYEHTKLEHALETAVEILKINENNFYQYKNLLTKAQWNLLAAIAKEQLVFQPQAKSFIQKYSLGTPALVKRGLDALLAKEMIYYQSGVEKPYYQVYDKFLMRWLSKN
jgi:AAA+ ATPase superfamily predicted ATPase